MLLKVKRCSYLHLLIGASQESCEIGEARGTDLILQGKWWKLELDGNLEQASTNESGYLLGTNPMPGTGGGSLPNQFLKSLQLPVHSCRHRWNLLDLFHKELGFREVKQLVHSHIVESHRGGTQTLSLTLFPAFKPDASLSSLRFPKFQSWIICHIHEPFLQLLNWYFL